MVIRGVEIVGAVEDMNTWIMDKSLHVTRDGFGVEEIAFEDWGCNGQGNKGQTVE